MEGKIIDFLVTKSIIHDFILHYVEYYTYHRHCIWELDLHVWCDAITIVELNLVSNL